jgi:SPX domain protein involved in polyphosphate accumulation
MTRSELAAPVLERYELKYTIPSNLVNDIATFVSLYCHPDRYSEASPDGYYQVNSLYLDSPEFYFLRQRLNGSESHFNMRVRTYGSKPSLPYFLEIKHKRGDIIRKYRAGIQVENLEKVLDPSEALPDHLKNTRDAENAVLFKKLVNVHNANPVAMTSYRRRAFFSHCDDYARITFDIGLKYMAQSEYLPLEVPASLAPSDVETSFDEGTSVILELKCYSKHVPLWMVDLIRKFELRRRGFSKYATAMSQVFRKYEFDTSLKVSPLADFRN